LLLHPCLRPGITGLLVGVEAVGGIVLLVV